MYRELAQVFVGCAMSSGLGLRLRPSEYSQIHMRSRALHSAPEQRAPSVPSIRTAPHSCTGLLPHSLPLASRSDTRWHLLAHSP